MARAWYGHVKVLDFFLSDPAVSSHVGRHGSVKTKSIGRSVISLTLTGVEVGRIQYTVNEKSSGYEESTDTRKGVQTLLQGEAIGIREVAQGDDTKVYRFDACEGSGLE